ncbi:small cell adhesion glycoprotein [Anomaloglossus baeobatrachus]|uniref:small cell adhesion glycoprotein n=1 Tax=Anomaloglossus baeobatrachus TaxID=238106 RepID=UPI003F4F6967
MALSTTVTSPETQTVPYINYTTSSPAEMDNSDKAVVAGVICAVFLTIMAVLALAALYLYKHKGSYHTNEPAEEEEAQKALETNTDPEEEKQEYLM